MADGGAATGNGIDLAGGGSVIAPARGTYTGGLWLDNPKYTPPGPGPVYTVAAPITGDPGYITGDALRATSNAYTIVNSTTLTGVGGGSRGVGLFLGGAVTNQSGGVIAGGFEGVDIEGVGVVLNAGTITGRYAVVARPGSTVTNSASGVIAGISDGIFLGQYGYYPPVSGETTTGTVVNRGSVSASGAYGLGNGIVLNVRYGAVDNFGTISGHTQFNPSATGLAVALNYGGLLTDHRSGLIQGFDAGVSADKGKATIANHGTITGVKTGVRLVSTGADGSTITNSGTISSGYAEGAAHQGNGVQLKATAFIRNEIRGYIYGGNDGIYDDAPAKKGGRTAIVNAGTIKGGVVGIDLKASANITNAAAGSIVGGVAGILRKPGASQLIHTTLRNDGSIYGTVFGAAFLAGVDTVINYGTISGGKFGIVSEKAGRATIENHGTITGGGGVAVHFGDRGGRLVEFPDAVLNGTAEGGGNGELELAAGQGTLAGFGVLYVHFTKIIVDAGASWDISGTGRANIVNDGVITVDGSFTFRAVAEDAGATGEFDVGNGAIATFRGQVDAAQSLVFTDATGSAVLAVPDTFRATVVGFGIGDRIDLANVPADAFTFADGDLVLTEQGRTVATLHFQGTYTADNFALSDDGAGGANIGFVFNAPRGIAALSAPASPESLPHPHREPAGFWTQPGG